MKNYSISPITSKKYTIPQSECDEGLANYFSDETKKKIVVMGQGFVGFVMALVCANSKNNYLVAGLDLADSANYWKIESINEGICPIISSDPKVQKYFNTAKTQNNLYATYDQRCLSYADVVIVDINLDVDKKYASNLLSFDVPIESFRSAVRSIGENCKEDALILVETTVPPGTCEKIIYPIIRENLKKRGLDYKKIKIGHSYERVMPGPNYIDSIKNFYRVYSGINSDSADATESFLKTIIEVDEYPLTRLSNTQSSEMGKVLENSFRAMNISFINEWSRFAEVAGVDLYEVVNAIRLRPTHANLMYPGIGVGGYCLTKDPLLASWSNQSIFNSKQNMIFSEGAVSENDRMPKYAYQFIKNVMESSKKKIKKIGMCGVAYAPGIGDTRFSPVEKLYELLIKDGYEIKLHDPYISYWEETNKKITKSIERFLLEKHDLVIFSTAHKEYASQEMIKNIESNNETIFIDTVGILSEYFRANSHKLNLHQLGSGLNKNYE